jgi:chemotaxis phosphatase CheX-like protein
MEAAPGGAANVNLSELLDAAAVSAQEIALGPLGAAHSSWGGASSEKLPTDLCGVYIPLLSDEFALQLGLLATRDVFTTLARALLGDIDGEEPMSSDADVFDAVGEVTNMIAGQVKVLLSERVNITVGVPLALKGRVFNLGGSQSIHGALAVDADAVWLVMTGTKMS